MWSIHGEDVGTTVTFSDFGGVGGQSYEVKHPWPEETRVSAGNGIVFVKKGEPYTTLFIEVYPPGASFIRGEGETPEQCEDAAWGQYQKALNCPAGEHEWESRGYKNGAGFCKHCGTFKSRCFTGDQLGQFCKVCGVGTVYTWEPNEDGTFTFTCEEHTPERSTEELFARLFGRD